MNIKHHETFRQCITHTQDIVPLYEQ